MLTKKFAASFPSLASECEFVARYTINQINRCGQESRGKRLLFWQCEKDKGKPTTTVGKYFLIRNFAGNCLRKLCGKI